MAKVAILGVGKMGAAMAKELAAANHEIILWNRTIEKAQSLANTLSNTIVASSVGEALKEADIALCMFVSGTATEESLLGNPSVLQNANKSIVIVDMGTSGVNSAKRLGAAISKAGLKFVDAPVSGNISVIAAHQLLIMASGNDADIATIEPVLMTFSKKVARVGEVGAGQVMKLAVNLVVHSLNAAVSEALALATTAGVTPEKVYEVFEESVIAAPYVKYKKASFLDPATPVAMRIDTVVKDLGLMIELGNQVGLALEATKAVEDVYKSAIKEGAAAEDMASLTRHLKR